MVDPIHPRLSSNFWPLCGSHIQMAPTRAIRDFCTADAALSSIGGLFRRCWRCHKLCWTSGHNWSGEDARRITPRYRCHCCQSSHRHHRLPCECSRRFRTGSAPQVQLAPISEVAANYALFMTASSNTRYQLVNSFEGSLLRLLPTYARNAVSVGVRTYNNYLGSANWIWWARLRGLQ